jgi:hypothetical protein
MSTSIAADQIKMENDLKLGKSIRDLEDRINIKLVEMENRNSIATVSLRKHIDDSLEIQRGIITKMTEEQRWMEEEGIRLRVEHEARMHNEIKALEDRLRRDEALTKANRLEVQLRRLTENLQRVFDEEHQDSPTVNTPSNRRRISTSTVRTSDLTDTLHAMLNRSRGNNHSKHETTRER